MNDIEVLHSRYAQALFEYAKENKIEDNIKDEYEQFCAVLLKNPEYKKIFVSPYLTRKEKLELLENIKKGLRLSNTFTSFLRVLIEQNRFAIIRGIYLKYMDLYVENKGIIRVNVYSAQDLTKRETGDLKKVFKKKLKKEIEIKNIIDEELLGGLKIAVEDNLIDASIKGKLDSIKESKTV